MLMQWCVSSVLLLQLLKVEIDLATSHTLSMKFVYSGTSTHFHHDNLSVCVWGQMLKLTNTCVLTSMTNCALSSFKREERASSWRGVSHSCRLHRCQLKIQLRSLLVEKTAPLMNQVQFFYDAVSHSWDTVSQL